jgi:DNA-binding LytR/AlgR family response regulator
MLRIAICDDDANEMNRTKEMCLSYKDQHPECDIRISSFSSPLDLKQSILQKETYDVFLLDIFMPEMTGTELARFIRESNEGCLLIFLTTSLAHAVEAFSLHATHYLVKPYTKEQFDDAMNKAVQAIDKQNKAQITLKTSVGMHKVNFADFIYSETDKHIQHILLADGRCIQVRITSTELFDLLSSDGRFFKCGSTYIINIGRIEEITKNYIIFENRKQIPMQRRQYKELIDRYTIYSLEGN